VETWFGTMMFCVTCILYVDEENRVLLTYLHTYIFITVLKTKQKNNEMPISL